MSPSAMLHVPATATPTIPIDRSYNCKCSSHSGAGVYEITLDEGIDALECVSVLTLEGAAGIVATGHITHTSDTVKVVNTNAAGVPADTVAFSAAFYRLPAGHP